jgi:hypothetical protein
VILNIRVVPRAGRKRVLTEGERLKVYLTRPAQDGLANAQLLDLLAEHLQIKRYQIRIIRGEKSRDKLVEVDAARVLPHK